MKTFIKVDTKCEKCCQSVTEIHAASGWCCDCMVDKYLNYLSYTVKNNNLQLKVPAWLLGEVDCDQKFNTTEKEIYLGESDARLFIELLNNYIILPIKIELDMIEGYLPNHHDQVG